MHGIRNGQGFERPSVDSMPKRYIHSAQKRSVHWWSQIAELRTACIQFRRAYLRSSRRRGRGQCTDERDAYKAARKTLRIVIRSAQERSWAELCATVDGNSWGLLYRVMMNKLGVRRSGATAARRENLIEEALFPPRPAVPW